MRNAVIAGSSGLTGHSILRFLLESKTYASVTAIVRKSLDLQHDHLRQQVVDFENLASDLARLEVAPETDLFCALGTTIKKAGSQEAFRAVDFHAVLQFAKWGAQGHAERFFLVSSMGALSESAFFYNRVKGDAERAVSLLDFQSVEIFRPSLLLGERTEFRPAERVADKIGTSLRFLFHGPLAPYRPIEAADVARAMVSMAETSRPSHKVNIFESREIQALADQAKGKPSR